MPTEEKDQAPKQEPKDQDPTEAERQKDRRIKLATLVVKSGILLLDLGHAFGLF